MPIPLFTNNAATSLAVAVTPTDTVFQVVAGTGQQFPTPTGGNYFMLTLVQINNPEVSEIVKCTSRVGDVLTVVRGQEGTQPQIFNISDNVALRITASSLNLFSGDNNANNINFTPYGFVTATNVQDAVDQTIDKITSDNGALASSTGSSLVGYKEGATSSVLRTVQSKLQETVSVKDFGAVGNGTTDDTAAIQAAITAAINAGGGKVYLPAGNYLISSTLNITGNDITIVGDGMNTTLITCNFAAGDIISIQNTSTIFCSNIQITQLGITSTITKTSGAAIAARGGHNLKLSYITLNSNLYTGFQFDAGAGNQFLFYLNDFEINSGSAFGIVVGLEGNGYTNLVADLFINRGSIANCGAGIGLFNASGVYLKDIDCIVNDKDVYICPTTGNFVQALWADTVLGDSANKSGWSLVSNGGAILDVNLSNIWASTCGRSNIAGDNHGIRIDAPSSGLVSNISITSPRCIGNYGHGIYVGGGEYITITNPQCSGNSNLSTQTNVYSGIYFTGNLSDFNVIGGACGNNGIYASANCQKYGIVVGNGGSTNFSIIGVDVTNNLTGGIYDGSGATVSKTISGNPGYVTSTNGLAKITAGTTTVIVPHGMAVTPNAYDIMLCFQTPGAGAVQCWVPNVTSSTFTINVNSAPSADIFITYWIRIKGS